MTKDSAFFSSLIEKGQLRVDEHGHAMLFGEFLFLVPPKVMIHLQEELEDRLGREEMEDLMTELGDYHVRQATDRYVDQYGMDDISKEKIAEFVQNLLKILGWGKVDIHTLNSDEFKAVVTHPTLPSIYRNELEKESDDPLCYYLAGVLSGAVNAISNQDFDIEEINCAATGGNKCIFEGQSTD